MKNAALVLLTAGLCGGLGLCPGCGGRDPRWEASTASVQAFGLKDAVAVADPDAQRVLLLTTDEELHLRTTPVQTQRGVLTVKAAPDGSGLFVVSEGDADRRPPTGKEVQGAALELVSRDSTGNLIYPLSEPFAGLALDPGGRWAVVYSDSTSSALVRNPNELLLVDLKSPAVPGVNPHPHTLRSFGGQPQRFTFTDVLNLPGGARRLLIVETEQDVALLDLLHPDAPEITIQLTSGQDTRQLRPAGVVFSEGDPAVSDDARIAIRLANDPTMILARLVPDSARDFRPELNLTDVGGVPSDAAFVRTDVSAALGALKLAVLVPERSKAVLIDPATSVTVDVPLPAPYARLSLVTDQAATPTSAVDVALLWNAATGSGGGGVSFWELGRTAGQPYRSVQTVGVASGVTSVVDVAGDHPQLKILGTDARTLFLLDLKSRTSSPFLTSAAGLTVTPSMAGDRAWAFFPNANELSVIDLDNLHPERMRVDRPVSAVFEIDAVDGGGAAAGARSLIAWHELVNPGVTVYDARATGATVPMDTRRNYSSILTEGFDVQGP
jgi:hypothetical protein